MSFFMGIVSPVNIWIYLEKYNLFMGNMGGELPVIADSSAVISELLTKNPSAGISIPLSTIIKSPTNSSD